MFLMLFSSVALQNTQVVVRDITPNRPVTWTGPGFMRVLEGSTLEFVIDVIPLSGEYDIIVRYEAQVSNWNKYYVVVGY